MRMDPPPAEPGATCSMPDATAAAAPPDDPPAVRSGLRGFRSGAEISLFDWQDRANSGMVVLPTCTAPEVLAFSERRSSPVWGSEFTNNLEPKVVTMPDTLTASLNARGRPCSGPTTPE